MRFPKMAVAVILTATAVSLGAPVTAHAAPVARSAHTMVVQTASENPVPRQGRSLRQPWRRSSHAAG